MAPLRRIAAAVFAGDARVWKTAGIVAIPLVAFFAYHWLNPRPYFTGTDSVNETTFIGPTTAGTPVCTPSVLELPANTAFVRLRVRSPTRLRPAMHLELHVGNSTISSSLAPARVNATRISNANFAIPQTPARPQARLASLCATASEGKMEWIGAGVPAVDAQSVSLAGAPEAAELGVWFLPPAGSERSYLQEAGGIFWRAALFRPRVIGAWVYGVLMFALLPALALLAVRSLAVALARGGRTRHAAAWVFAIAALNFACWALITPPFQAPDEVDHFAYVQSLVERGETPTNNPAVPRYRWANAESLALEVTAFMTDHEVNDTRMPGTTLALQRYHQLFEREHPPANDGGGYSTSAAHGPLYYLALSPGYLVAQHDSAFAQITWMRLTSALLGALAALFAFLLARELAPTRPWLGVLAAMIVVYEPMYGFISGAVNNDVGVNAAAAAVAYLLVRLLRRGLTIPWGLATGLVLVALPLIKETGLSIYPVAALALIAGLYLHHSRAQLKGWAALAVGAIVMNEISARVLSTLQPAEAKSGFSAIGSNTSAAHVALTHIPEYLSYLWQIFLPRLPGMSQHFAVGGLPAYTIFIKRGWGAFGWFDIFFPEWVYRGIALAIIVAIPLGLWAARREWTWIRRNWMEVLTVLLIPVAVIAGFEAAYFSGGVQTLIPTYGRYAFPAIAPLAVIAVGVLHGFGRRNMVYVGVALMVAMIGLSYGAQMLTLTSFYG
ncbi:MAG TPA: hypothetical protein VMB51_08595 [Solirubrobacteraceae bacterium]|nr:hypothetical protein [Solirubrobacteraceae bacterium]